MRRVANNLVGDYGEPQLDNNTDTAMWAEVRYPGNPAESMKAHQIFPQRDVVFIVRHPNPTDNEFVPVFNQRDSIIFEDREYDILGFEEIGRRDGLRIYCKERGSDGR